MSNRHWTEDASDAIGNIAMVVLVVGVAIGAAIAGGIWAIVHFCF